MTPLPRTTTSALFLLLVTAFFFFVAITGAAVTTTPPPHHQKPLQLKLHHKHNHSDENYIHSKIKGDRTRRQKWISAAKMVSSTNFTLGQELDLGITVGIPFRNGEYAIYADIGSHKSRQIFSLDTGSNEAWLQCKPCSRDCYDQRQVIYDPILSADSEKVLYTDQLCSNVSYPQRGKNNECIYRIGYANKSYTLGQLTRDKISWTEEDGRELFSAKIPIGCGYKNVGFNGISGILPLSRGPLSLVTLFNLQSLSYCLGDTGTTSYIIFNDTSSPHNGEDTVHLKLLRGVGRTETFLYVELTKIIVGSQVVPIPEGTFDLRPDGSGGGVILDTGSILTYLTKQAYDPLEAAFIAQTQTLTTVDPPSPYKKCFVVTEGVQNIYPDIIFNFQQGKLQLRLGGAIVIVAQGIECFGILPEEEYNISTIGSFSQIGIQFKYDFGQNDISMTFNKC